MLEYIILAGFALYGMHLLYGCLKSLFKTIKPWFTIAFARLALHKIKSMYIPLLIITISVCAILYYLRPITIYLDETGFYDYLADFYGFIYENRPHAKQSILIIILVCPYLFKRCFSQKNK